MPFSIRRARPEDAGEIARIYLQTSRLHYEKRPDVFREPSFERTLKYVSDNIGKQNPLVFKAEEQNKIRGYLVLYIDRYPPEFFVQPNSGFIGSIGVDEKERGRGTGTALIKAAEKYLKEQGIGLLQIDFYTFNTDAERLYESLGYEDCKHLRQKYL